MKRRRETGDGEVNDRVEELHGKTESAFIQAGQVFEDQGKLLGVHDTRLGQLELAVTSAASDTAEMRGMLNRLLTMVSNQSIQGGGTTLVTFADLARAENWPKMFPGPSRLEVVRAFEVRFERLLHLSARPGVRDQAKSLLGILEGAFEYFTDPERSVTGCFGDKHVVGMVDRAIKRLVALQYGEEADALCKMRSMSASVRRTISASMRTS